ncbi:tripartite tricarboxylate transporter substrate binding protein [Roseomonas sp. AR75]|uniref:Bug family tripartite tricarboxylate transporter substrate binding protein n=1 Tax=Roseomonas sp. AR75 TaxID=2562311 RepID=UPI0010BFB205|nr:tripartite tricarboxylate transporter substrate binding protein [Roseomonas sp. AR75]
MMNATRRALFASAAVLALPGLARAQSDYPTRPIRLVVPFPPGATVDVTARTVAARAAELLGANASIVVENLPGAGGNIATQRVARERPDGYTLLFTAPNHTVNPALNPNSGYDPEKDFAPISLVAQIPEILIAPVSAPFTNFQEFVAYARANPGKLSYSSAGIGTHPHVVTELLLSKLGLQVLHVPYRGAAPALTDTIAGRVQLKMDSYVSSAPHIAAGTIRVLALANLQRSPLMPNVPTVQELGLPGFEGILWMGVLAPAGTPEPIVAKLSQAFMGAVRTPAIAQRLSAQGVEPVGNTPEQFRAIIAKELPQWREVIRAANIQAQ